LNLTDPGRPSPPVVEQGGGRAPPRGKVIGGVPARRRASCDSSGRFSDGRSQRRLHGVRAGRSRPSGTHVADSSGSGPAAQAHGEGNHEVAGIVDGRRSVFAVVVVAVVGIESSSEPPALVVALRVRHRPLVLGAGCWHPARQAHAQARRLSCLALLWQGLHGRPRSQGSAGPEDRVAGRGLFRLSTDGLDAAREQRRIRRCGSASSR